MVASSQPLASLTGIEILRAGGNAVDAAVATAAMLNVVEPMATGIGGDAFALIYEARTGAIRGLNASGRSAYAATPEEYRRRLGGAECNEIPSSSLLAVTVPGSVDGWALALEKYGRMSLADVLAPAIQTAENGFPVAPQTAATWKEWQHALTPYPDSRQTWFLPSSGAPRPGEIFKSPGLAGTLRLISEGGRDVFYRGPIADRIVRFSEQNGGLFTLADFSDHSSTLVEPISVTYRGYEVLELPPNGQGIVTLETLQILAQDDLASMGHNLPDTLHLQIEALKTALHDGKQYVTDPDFTDIPVGELTSLEYAQKQRARITMDQANRHPSPGLSKPGDTVYLCTADAEGNVVSFISSIFFPWGTGITVGDTGILLQNRGSSFSLDPSHPNCIAPHKRTRHTIIPSMVLENNRPLIAFGFVGGDLQPQAQVQFLTNLIDFDMNLQDALDAPRWRYEGTGASIAVEEMMPTELSRDLSKRGHDISGTDGFFGGGQAILIHPDYNTLQGGSDSRRDGCAIGF